MPESKRLEKSYLMKKDVTLNYFDCNAMLGRYYNPVRGDYLTASNVVSLYEQFNINEGVVFHASARDYNAMHGNELLTKEIQQRENLHAAWVVLPHHTEEMSKPEELAQQLKHNNVKIVRIFCGHWHYMHTLDPFVYGQLFEMLEHYQIPVMVEAVGAGGVDTHIWRDIQTVLASFPELHFIFLYQKTAGLNRYLFPLFERFENFMLETSGYHHFGGIETIVKEFGPRRLVFGTRIPYCNIPVSIAALQYAEISIDEKKLIAGDNLRHLMSRICL